MGVHMKREVINLVERFVTDVTLVLFLGTVGEFMVFVISLLMETFSTKFARERFVIEMYAHVRVQGGATIERFAARGTLMRFL